MKKVILISLSNLHKDPRVLRQYHILKEKYEITTIGYSLIDDKVPGMIVPKSIKYKNKYARMLGLFARMHSNTLREEYPYYENAQRIKSINPYAVVINDVRALPFLNGVPKGVKVWLDLHEYSPKQYNDRWMWRNTIGPYYSWLLRNFKSQVDSFSTVCQGIADEYTKEFGIENIDIITNAPEYIDIEPSEIGEKIRIVHHGVATPGRRLEKLIEVVRELGNKYTLDFYLVSDLSDQKVYLEQLKSLSSGLPIRFNNPVSTEQLARKLNQYDIGVFYLEPNTFNHLYALPNKVFEYIQARLALVVTPNPEMKKLVESYNLGEVAIEYSVDSFVDAIRRISKEDLKKFKNNSNINARELSLDMNRDKILKIFEAFYEAN